MTRLTPPCPTCGRQRAVTVRVCGYCVGAIAPSVGPGVAASAPPVDNSAVLGRVLFWGWLLAGAAVTQWLVNNTPFHRLPVFVGMLVVGAVVFVALGVVGVLLYALFGRRQGV